MSASVRTDADPQPILWHQVALSDRVPTPWRNGGGQTRELVAWPDPQNWLWRLSVAEVERDGPFSRFEGVQRWFAVLSGGGVRLVRPQDEVVLQADSAPWRFGGGDEVQATLLAGPTQDFNLMVRDGPAADVSGLWRLAGARQQRIDAPKVVAVYSTGTPVTLRFDAQTLLLPPHTLVWAELPAGLDIQATGEGGLWIELPAAANPLKT